MNVVVPKPPPRLEEVVLLIEEMSPADRARLRVALQTGYDTDGKPQTGLTEEVHRLRR